MNKQINTRTMIAGYIQKLYIRLCIYIYAYIGICKWYIVFPQRSIMWRNSGLWQSEMRNLQLSSRTPPRPSSTITGHWEGVGQISSCLGVLFKMLDWKTHILFLFSSFDTTFIDIWLWMLVTTHASHYWDRPKDIQRLNLLLRDWLRPPARYSTCTTCLLNRWASCQEQLL